MQTIYGSHGAIAPFSLARPAAAAEAAALLAQGGREAAFLAGGVDLVPALRAGRRVSTLVSLDRIEALRAIRAVGGTLVVGAGVTYAQLAGDPTIRAALPDLAAVWAAVANVRIRHVATLGGNIMSGNPAYDALPALMALGARLTFLDASGAQRIVDPQWHPLADGLLLSVAVPLPPLRRFVFDRSLKPALSAAVAVERQGAGLVGRAAFGCAHARPVCLSLDVKGAADLPAVAAAADRIAEEVSLRLPEPLDDAIAGAAYRRELARVLVRRALRSLEARP